MRPGMGQLGRGKRRRGLTPWQALILCGFPSTKILWPLSVGRELPAATRWEFMAGLLPTGPPFLDPTLIKAGVHGLGHGDLSPSMGQGRRA